ncbi:hypothetical protein [Lentzea sp. HUAS12]|uniref:hypothetical protein n=1 Tax=Lentzea sp. HUAS12 TaxID=2951806 RepID=UPI00209CBF33|nr:hypothetical protein [Lentzea sp. HUAS12]USX56378.1 hypothetical protein ND450_20425 [Lentzea sp. HUAS12]
MLSVPAAHASEYPPLNPQPAQCTAQVGPSGSWCTYFNPENPNGRSIDGRYYKPGTYDSFDRCRSALYANVRSPYDKGQCGATRVYDGLKNYEYYNLYLRFK